MTPDDSSCQRSSLHMVYRPDYALDPRSSPTPSFAPPCRPAPTRRVSTNRIPCRSCPRRRRRCRPPGSCRWPRLSSGRRRSRRSRAGWIPRRGGEDWTWRSFRVWPPWRAASRRRRACGGSSRRRPGRSRASSRRRPACRRSAPSLSPGEEFQPEEGRPTGPTDSPSRASPCPRG